MPEGVVTTPSSLTPPLPPLRGAELNQLDVRVPLYTTSPLLRPRPPSVAWRPQATPLESIHVLHSSRLVGMPRDGTILVRPVDPPWWPGGHNVYLVRGLARRSQRTRHQLPTQTEVELGR